MSSKNLIISLTGSGAFGYAKSAYSYANETDYLINLSEYIPEGRLYPIWGNHKKNLPQIILDLRTLIKDTNIDKIIAIGKESTILLFLARLFIFTKRPVIICAHITNESEHIRHTKSQYFFQAKIVQFIYRIIFKAIRKHVCVSLGVKDDLIQNFNIDSNRIETIYPKSSVQIIGTDSESQNFIYIGRIVADKQIIDILKAFQLFKNIVQLDDIKLNIIGDGNDLAYLENECNNLRLAGSVIFHGYSPNPWSMANKNSILLMASKYEGFPTVISEAFGVGIPCISYNFPSGPSEIIENGLNGYLVDENTPENLAKKMIQAYNMNWDKEKIIASSRSINQTNDLWKFFLSS